MELLTLLNTFGMNVNSITGLLTFSPTSAPDFTNPLWLNEFHTYLHKHTLNSGQTFSQKCEARSKSMVMGEVSHGSGGSTSPGLHEGVLKAGWLKKQRSIMKNWQLRWFVLRSDYLYFYKDEEETKPQGSPQRIIRLHTTLSSTSASFTPTTCMSSLTTFMNLLLGLPLFLLPGGSIFIILLPI
ncbi:rho GTPase-activating protein 22-like [Silurus meridionalis]|nr:rho GTPase-activating protein 22-like [Silurus meridionalis]